MGYQVEHAIIVTSCDEKLIAKARKKAAGIFPHVSNVAKHIVNGGGSFLVPPDGSKEGWNESREGDERRQIFVEWLNKQRYEDGSTSLRWVEVLYADDERRAKIISGDHIQPKGKP